MASTLPRAILIFASSLIIHDSIPAAHGRPRHYFAQFGANRLKHALQSASRPDQLKALAKRFFLRNFISVLPK